MGRDDVQAALESARQLRKLWRETATARREARRQRMQPLFKGGLHRIDASLIVDAGYGKRSHEEDAVEVAARVLVDAVGRLAKEDDGTPLGSILTIGYKQPLDVALIVRWLPDAERQLKDLATPTTPTTHGEVAFADLLRFALR